MKKLILLAFAVTAYATINAQTGATGSKELVFKEEAHDFGKIPQGKPVHYQFVVTNTTDKAIEINSVQATCGCTTPEWDHEPIAAHKESVINVGYNAASEGPFEKYIMVTYNGGQTLRLKINGTVWKTPMNGAPENASITFLKKQIDK